MKKYQPHPGISRPETLRLILERAEFQHRVEMVPIREALHRVTAGEIRSLNTLPNTPSSSMDGIAVNSAQLTGGIPQIEHWHEGMDYVFSNTGVGIPDEYDTVVLIEDVAFDEAGRLCALKIPQAGDNVRPVGATLQAGELLVPDRFCLQPAQLGLLAAGGISEVTVLAKPRVAILPTGNELVPAGYRPPRGKNVEYNGTMIEAQVKTMGAEARLYPITRDNPADLFRVLQDALVWADIVVLNGGSSKGSDDRAIEVLESVGEVLVYEVDYGPGKHTTMTIAGTKPIVGAVGPTIGAEYAIEWYVGPLINKYLAQSDREPQKIAVKLLEDLPAPVPFDFYARLDVQKSDGAYVARPVGRSASLAKQMLVNACLRVPGEVPGYRAGETVEAELRWGVIMC